MSTRRVVVTSGITLGNIVAALISWHVNHNFLWVIIDFFLSWVYVVYALVVYFHFDFHQFFQIIEQALIFLLNALSEAIQKFVNALSS